MRITIPVYVEERRKKGSSLPVFAARPLFERKPEVKHEDLRRSLQGLARKLRRDIDSQAREDRHEDLARLAHAPIVRGRVLKLDLDLRKRVAHGSFLVASFEGLGGRVGFFPAIPDVWFTARREADVEKRASEVLAAWFRERIDREERPEDRALQGRAWVTSVDVEGYRCPAAEIQDDSKLITIEQGEVRSGAVELDQVGHCLEEWLSPEDAGGVLFRDVEIAEVARLVRDPERPPVLLVGPRGVGKTAIVEEQVRRALAKRHGGGDRNTWLLAPQRLISGMSYVGQWESRLLAILKEAIAREHVLYFDDLVGLFRAGITADARLSVAHVLKPYLERREVRILGEATPEGFRVLQELDRGFADLFHVLPVREPSAEETLRILIGAMRRIEADQRAKFDLEALPAALDLQRRYVRDVAFPGKAVRFLAAVAAKRRGKQVARVDVLEEFHRWSGLSLGVLDTRLGLDRKAVLEGIGRDLVGQSEAVQACADVVCIAKARLNDPDRPLASLLFLGPTGVGKTECAKALARYLFGDEERILRFDMNEYVDPGAPARLVGTFDEPEGLLTSAIRRQPFSVVLLDEIEKADPRVFDLLLQVLGEGRLTDALGRTADFANAIFVLTSNLGTREAEGGVGFKPLPGDRGAYLQAAERFFRPEFFNRLDRVVPFQRLTRDEVGRIARRLIRDLFAREGLRRRRCILDVDPRALEAVIDEGYHPQLGARALKRAIERRVAQPVSARLSTLAPETPTVITLVPEAGAFGVRVDPLVNATPRPGCAWLAAVEPVEQALSRAEAMLARLEASIETARPTGGTVDASSAATHYGYYQAKEQAQKVRRFLQALHRSVERPARGPRMIVSLPARHVPASADKWDGPFRDLWREMCVAQDVSTYLGELVEPTRREDRPLPMRVRDLFGEVALLAAMARRDERALVWVVDTIDEPFAHGASVLEGVRELLEEGIGVTASWVSRPLALLVEGPGAALLAETEAGTRLFHGGPLGFQPVLVRATPLTPAEDAAAAWSTVLAALRDQAGALPPVVRVHELDGPLADLRTGQVVRGKPAPARLREWLLSQLPLPEEGRP